MNVDVRQNRTCRRVFALIRKLTPLWTATRSALSAGLSEQTGTAGFFLIARHGARF